MPREKNKHKEFELTISAYSQGFSFGSYPRDCVYLISHINEWPRRYPNDEQRELDAFHTSQISFPNDQLGKH